MYRGSYLTNNILTVKGKYDPHAYIRGKYGPKHPSGVDIILHTYLRDKYDL